ncbi:PAS domain-containing protein [Haloarchaeobius amylolyticus]|uniref:PAS domain-containing protein n=1 Tax=Haloarchaeobius amylolyticus TaxID=1198296 RepID=UPI00226FB65B|nr:PAS domain-containing protein [Haloarchaeobius amylolyticus]
MHLQEVAIVTYPANPPAGPTKVLYVNSDPAFTELVRTKLGQRIDDVEYLSARDRETALQTLEDEQLDCMVTAYSLADSDGIDLTSAVRQRDETIPIILFTGHGSEEIAGESTRAGVSDYIPIRAERNDFDLLASRIQTLVSAARERTAAERANRQLQRTLDRTTDAVYAVDDDWRIEYMNDRMADRVGRDPSAVIGSVLWEEFPSVRGTEIEDRYRAAMESGEPASFEYHVGDPFDYWVEIRVFPDENGLTIFSREVTEERERQHELERDRTILQRIHDVVLVLDEDGVIKFANDSAARALGEPAPANIEEVRLDSLVSDRVADADAERFVRAVEETLQEFESDGGTSGLYDADLRIGLRTATGDRTFDVRLTPCCNPDGREVLVVARDITTQSDDHQQVERERDALRELQRVMAEDAGSTDDRVAGLLEAGCQTLGLDVGIVSRIEGGDYTVRAVHAPVADIEAGDRFDLGSTYCADVVDQSTVCSFQDAVDAGYETHPAYHDRGIESYIGVPIDVDGEQYGTISFSSPQAAVTPFGEPERTYVELLSELVSAELSRDRSRVELERQQFLFDRVQDIADIGIWEYEPSSGELTWSDGVRRIHGVEPTYDPTLSDGIEFYHPDDRERITAAVERAVEDGTPYDLDLRIVRADGEVRDVRAWGEPVESQQHGGTVLRGVLQDITERKRQDQERRELAEEYEAVLETSGDAIFLVDVEGAEDEPEFRFARLSSGYEEQTGLTTDDVQGKTPREVFGEEQGTELDANYRRCIAEGEPISYREELPVTEDARYWETGLAPVVVDGEVVRIVGIARNITQRVERERQLEATNQRLESLVEAAPLTIAEIDRDGTVVRLNEGAEEMFGIRREDVLGETPSLPHGQQGEFDTYRARAFDGERVHRKEIELETGAGRRLDGLMSMAPLTDEEGTVTSVLVVLENITDQKDLERNLRALQETAQELSMATSTAEIGEVAVEAAEEVLGFDIAGIWEYNAQQDALVPVTETAVARELFDESPRFTGGDSLAWEAFQTGELRSYDDVQSQTTRHNPDTALRSEILVPLGEDGLLAVGSSSPGDISETDIDLLRIFGSTLEAAIARASREEVLQRQNERLDQFASVVAHDLRNPLTIAMGFLDVAEETGDPGHFEEVAAAHDRMERLIEDLLTLARGGTAITDPEEIDIGTVAVEAWGYVDTVDATLSAAADVPTVAGDGGRLTQLFENLFRNAVEHAGADVTVSVGPLAGEDGAFYVEDDGDGIPPEKREEVFESGVTSNEGGTGFGLSIVEEIASVHGWKVSLTEGSYGGARFEFRQTG